MQLYTDTIHHGITGDIHVYWGSDGLLKGVYFGISSLDIMSAKDNISKNFPEIFEMLLNFPEIPFEQKHLKQLDLSKYSEFTVKIYATLVNTVKGEVITYGTLAEKAGYPLAARACGCAMRKNNFPLLIPCHRVVGVNSIGNYSMGGVDLKIKLMELEGYNFENKK